MGKEFKNALTPNEALLKPVPLLSIFNVCMTPFSSLSPNRMPTRRAWSSVLVVAKFMILLLQSYKVLFCNSLDGRRPANLQTALVTW
jgi:hypothetical protein